MAAESSSTTPINGSDVSAKVDKSKIKLLEKRAAKKRSRKQAKKHLKRDGSVLPTSGREASDVNGVTSVAADADATSETEVDIEYVTEENPTIVSEHPSYESFAKVFEKFAVLANNSDDDADDDLHKDDAGGHQRKALQTDDDKSDGHDKDDDDDDDELAQQRRAKKANRMSVAELKQQVKKPEVVEWVDITATDPHTLVHLKSYRNTVPVPIHWQQKRKYLQGKRGIEKPPFELPEFIKATGIMEMRASVKEKEEATKLKSKTRERHQPKMGKLTIDYQKLHDAFFRLQTKPKFTIHGDLYYEGKEYETKPKMTKPGVMSDDLKNVLGMPPLAPPPWLINMQRYGPPPSYPNLKIPGLNAPIPLGAQWGYHPGGWGRPPVDEYNRPLYGDVFGINQPQIAHEHVAPIERALWGEMEEEEYEEEEEAAPAADEQEGDDEEGKAAEREEGLATPVIETGLVTPSGIASSVPSGLETPEFIELRKDIRRPVGDAQQKSLYTVIPERATSIVGFMGSDRLYDVSVAQTQAAAAAASAMPDTLSKKRKNMVEVALNPEDMGDGALDPELLKKKYEETLEERAAANQPEDFSDMVAEHAQKMSSKKRKADSGSKKGPKEKDFKF
ncbi:hypothetical protein SeMB42_g01453 [Synchytrium endobioticum]|uniref:PSP proline-rich domain-containing protein n=1 Tax=Synchytrium endobioticum TaxID=286115 RepID=A0A507DMJ2_9FUNG|nr:hypothetical protein SeLEV6574_g02790 [Synchytrium endobioticum]TPX52407.1 hypothetical protein SeMB42_g01453 [Synchytrium endobioticum]